MLLENMIDVNEHVQCEHFSNFWNNSDNIMNNDNDDKKSSMLCHEEEMCIIEKLEDESNGAYVTVYYVPHDEKSLENVCIPKESNETEDVKPTIFEWEEIETVESIELTTIEDKHDDSANDDTKDIVWCCPEENKSTKYRRKKYNHDNTTRDPLICEKCGTQFTYKSNLKCHILKFGHYLTSDRSNENDSFIKTVFPEKWPVTVLKMEREGNWFIANIRIKTIKTADELREWMRHFMELTKCVYVSRSIRRNRTSATHFSEYYRCEHYTSRTNGKRRTKGTDCKSHVYTSIKKNWLEEGRYAALRIHFFHNHEIGARFMRASAPVRAIFEHMFESGLSSGTALLRFKEHMRANATDEQAAGERLRQCPDRMWTQHLFANLYRNTYESSLHSVLLYNMVNFILAWNTQLGHVCSFKQLDNDYRFVAAIVTPLMARALETNTAAETMVVEQTDNPSRYRLKLFFLLTNTIVGAIPLGLVITTGDNENDVAEAFHLYQSMLGEKSFGGRGSAGGPCTMLTSESGHERTALRKLFPMSKVLTHPIYVLRAAWNWLNHIRNAIPFEHRHHLFALISRMLHASNEQQFDDIYQQIIHQDNIASRHPFFIRYVNHLHRKRVKWALCYRDGLLSRSNYLNAAPELGFRKLKERTVHLLKDPMQLLHFVRHDFDDYFARKLIAACTDDERHYFQCPSIHGLRPTSDELCKYSVKVQDGCVLVTNVNSMVKYWVQCELGVCTCYVGLSGEVCKHQVRLSKTEDCHHIVQWPRADEERAVLRYIANGEQDDVLLTAIDANTAATVEDSNFEDSGPTSAVAVVADFEAECKLLISRARADFSKYGPDLISICQRIKHIRQANDNPLSV